MKALRPSAAPPPGDVGRLHRRAKTPQRVIRLIRQYHAAGKSVRWISLELAISARTVRRYL